MQTHTHLQDIKSILLVSAKTIVSFGEKLRGWRKAKGMTQEELAKASSVNVSYISNLERDFSANTRSGKPRASEPLCHRFAKVLGVPVGEVLDEAGYKGEPKKPTTAKEALDLIAKMIPGFEGVLLHDGLTDENAERLLEDFKTLMELQNRRAKKESDI